MDYNTKKAKTTLNFDINCILTVGLSLTYLSRANLLTLEINPGLEAVTSGVLISGDQGPINFCHFGANYWPMLPFRISHHVITLC